MFLNSRDIEAFQQSSSRNNLLLKGLNMGSFDSEDKMKTLENISFEEKIDKLYFQRIQIFKAIQHYRFSL